MKSSLTMLAVLAVGALTTGSATGTGHGSAVAVITDAGDSSRVEMVAEAGSRLWEFRTADLRGHFYTASESEAARAAGQGFQRKPDQLGYLPGPSAMTTPVHRLRFLPHQAYLVTGDPGEIQRLLGSGQFVDDGVLGHVYRVERPGTTLLKRFSQNSDWRLAPAHRAWEFERAGYHEDGPVGWVYTG